MLRLDSRKILLKTISEQYQKLLGENLIGIYIFMVQFPSGAIAYYGANS